MANTDLLKEAIADAKSVKETAIANAKLALEEAFTPHLKSMLSAKLEEMDKEDVDEGYDKYEEDDVKEEMDSKDDVKEEKEEVEEINLDELLAELELDENARTDAEEEGYKDGIKDEKEDLKEDERTDAEEEGYEDGMEDEKEDEEDKDEDEEIDLEDMSEDDLKGFIEDVIKDMVAGGEIEPGDEFAEDEVDVEVEDVEDVEDVDVDIEIDEAKQEELDEKMTKKEKAEGDDRKKDDKIEAETEKMRFKEALDEIDALKVELQEVNLLNAKLLYTNKIFKAKNLTESKKVKVLKAFDKAEDVRQAKTIYDTLAEGLVNKPTNTVVSESVKRGFSSKATGLSPKATKQPIIESNEVFDRMRKLAGLI